MATNLDLLAWAPVYRTDALPARDRYSAWRDADVATLSTRFDTVPREPFSVSMDWLDLGILGIGHTRITANDWIRETGRLNRDGCDDLVVSIRHVGGASGDMNGRDVSGTTGSIMLADLAQPQAHRSDASITTGFVIPRAIAEQTLPSVRSLHGHVIAPRHAALLVSHVAMIHQHAGNLPRSSGPGLAQTVLDLFAVSLAASMGGVPADEQQYERGLDFRLRDTIERQLGSASLNTARLSKTLGVSRSTLYRLLQHEGGVQAYIRNRRLARIADTLRDPADRQTIAALAERWGFCDAAYLGRAFREAYGVTPGDYRMLHGIADR
jgi:AraC-like DNA-binding protein